MSTPSPLPELPAWHARSFWIMVVGALSALASLFQFDLLALVGVPGQEELVDKIMQIVPLAAIIWSWVERRRPSYQLTLKPVAHSTGGRTLLSLAVPALLVLALAGCGADGTFKSPAEMTAQERCDNAALALALVEANMPPGSETVERARVNYRLICGLPVELP